MSDDEISISKIVAATRSRWKLVLLLPLLGAMLAVGVSFLMTKVYRAQIVVSPAQPDNLSGGALSRLAGSLGAFGGLMSEIGLGGGGADQSKMWIATLRSRAALEAFVRQGELMPILFPTHWDADKKQWKVRNGKSMEPTMDDAVRFLRQAVIQIDEDKRTGLITVAMNWRDRQLAARWANDFVTMVNSMARERTIDDARRSITYLESELERTNVFERHQIIYRLIESRENDIMLAKGRLDYAFAIVDAATIPDQDKYASPRRFVLLALGMFAGIVCAGILVFLRAVGSTP